MRTYYLALDLKNDPALIAKYESYHHKVWPEVIESIKAAGVLQMQIYRAGNRLFMRMDVSAEFTFAAKAAADAKNVKIQEWEALMWEYQQAMPFAQPGEKWVLLDEIFSLK